MEEVKWYYKPSFNQALQELKEESPLIHEIVQLAISWGKTGCMEVGEVLITKMNQLVEALKLLNNTNEDEDDEDLCYKCDSEYLDNPCSCCDEDDEDEDDYEDDDNYEDEEYEEDEEKEPDPLSEQLGLDVDEASPMELAKAIRLVCGSDEVQRDKFVMQLGERGQNIAHLTVLTDALMS